MNKFKSTICAALALTFAAGTMVPATAAPAFAPQTPIASDNLVQIQTREQKRRFNNAQERRQNRFNNRQDRREGRFERRAGNPYYNGRRGYRDRRAGYRQYNGFWFPASAFIAGAIIGGAVSGSASGGGSSHVEWCSDRWRSYRVSDNSYQPSNGPRQRCVSPYS